MMRNYLKSFNILSNDDIDVFESKVIRKTLKKGDYFIQEGKTSKEVAFVVSGLFRSFYYSSSDEEITYCFTFSNTFLSAYSSLLSQTKTVENIQALTAVELFTISRDEILKLEESSTNWLRFFKFIAEQEYIKMEKRIFILQKESAEKRYEDLLKNQPQYLQLIPLNYLSCYLGITQRHLSRIRKSTLN
jgi:CRP-like cAMP-binding protein